MLYQGVTVSMAAGTLRRALRTGRGLSVIPNRIGRVAPLVRINDAHRILLRVVVSGSCVSIPIVTCLPSVVVIVLCGVAARCAA